MKSLNNNDTNTVMHTPTFVILITTEGDVAAIYSSNAAYNGATFVTYDVVDKVTIFENTASVAYSSYNVTETAHTPEPAFAPEFLIKMDACRVQEIACSEPGYGRAKFYTIDFDIEGLDEEDVCDIPYLLDGHENILKAEAMSKYLNEGIYAYADEHNVGARGLLELLTK